MFDNLTVVAIITFILWLGILGIYLYSSRQQQALRQDIDALRQQLDHSAEKGRE